MQKYSFQLVMATAFLDILGIGVLVPVLPFIIKEYGVSVDWVGYSMAIYSLGLFLGGLVFGRLSDKFGRRPMLMITTLFNFFGYLLIVYSPLFWIFLAGRFIWGLGGAGIGIVQAYVSDISSKENRTIRLGFIGAMFGLGFLIGPAIGGLLASFGNHFVGYAGAFFVFLNFLLVTFFLPEPKRHMPAEGEIKTEKNSFGVPKEIILLLVVSFLATIAFSPIQAISGLFYADVFGFDAVAYSHVLILIGAVSIVYQGFLVKHIRKYISEAPMIVFALGLLAVAYLLQAFNVNPILIWVIAPLFPIGMGSFQPSSSSLIAHESGHQVGKYMGYSTSAVGLGSIIGPAIGGFLYMYGPTVPFMASAGLFIVTMFIALPLIRKHA